MKKKNRIEGIHINEDKDGKEIEILTETHDVYLRYSIKERLWEVDIFDKDEPRGKDEDTIASMSFERIDEALGFISNQIKSRRQMAGLS